MKDPVEVVKTLENSPKLSKEILYSDRLNKVIQQKSTALKRNKSERLFNVAHQIIKELERPPIPRSSIEITRPPSYLKGKLIQSRRETIMKSHQQQRQKSNSNIQRSIRIEQQNQKKADLKRLRTNLVAKSLLQIKNHQQRLERGQSNEKNNNFNQYSKHGILPFKIDTDLHQWFIDRDDPINRLKTYTDQYGNSEKPKRKEKNPDLSSSIIISRRPSINKVQNRRSVSINPQEKYKKSKIIKVIQNGILIEIDLSKTLVSDLFWQIYKILQQMFEKFNASKIKKELIDNFGEKNLLMQIYFANGQNLKFLRDKNQMMIEILNWKEEDCKDKDKTMNQNLKSLKSQIFDKMKNSANFRQYGAKPSTFVPSHSNSMRNSSYSKFDQPLETKKSQNINMPSVFADKQNKKEETKFQKQPKVKLVESNISRKHRVSQLWSSHIIVKKKQLFLDRLLSRQEIQNVYFFKDFCSLMSGTLDYNDVKNRVYRVPQIYDYNKRLMDKELKEEMEKDRDMINLNKFKKRKHLNIRSFKNIEQTNFRKSFAEFLGKGILKKNRLLKGVSKRIQLIKS